MPRAELGTAVRHLRDLFGVGTVGALGDGQLLARYCASNEEVAFEALVARHGPMVLATCRAVLRCEHDVEDAFQTTFLVLAKKAHSIRGGDALGGWLHRVAYRAAIQASVEAKRRRQNEAEASAMATLVRSGRSGETENDLRPILHEEIERLPASQRLPVVLCDLQGLTYEQAAEQLRWSIPTFRCRLARARQRLKGRLTLRGFATAAIFAVPQEVARAAVPPTLLHSTVLAATGGQTSAGAAILTHAILRGMLMTEIKFAATAALALLAIASAGVLAGGRLPEDSKPAMKPKAASASGLREQRTAEKPLETVEIKARVVAPDGRPVAGASVGALFFRGDTVLMTTSAADGRSSLRLPKPDDEAALGGYQAMYPWLVAAAPGFGVGWSERALRPDRPSEQVVTLVPEGPPIEGRIVDLEGRPVVGANVQITVIYYHEHGDMAGWVAKARNGAAGNIWQGLASLSLDAISSKPKREHRDQSFKIAATTGTDGRFKLTGIGRDRIADLIVSGAGIATTEVYAFSRPELEIRSVDRGMMRRPPFTVHAPQFQLAVAPGRRVEGVIRDKDSGAPIAGLKLEAAVFEEHSLVPDPGIDAVTDADGRYRLDGLAKAAAYRLFLKTAKGLPYTNATFKVPAESPGIEPISFDIAMKRGVFVRGRVADKVTGRPIRGYAYYYAVADNPNISAYAGFSKQYAAVDEEGRYEVVALPGRGSIAVRDDMARYRPASGDNAIVAEVVVDPKAESMTLDLQADPGKSVAIQVVGPDGAPIVDTKVKGLHELFQSRTIPEPSSRFEVNGLDPSRPRRVVVMHEARELIGTTLLKGDQTGPVTIKLEPWGSVAGRIVDDEGRPRKAMFIGSPDGSLNKHPETHDIVPWSDWNQGIRVGDDGRFQIKGLVPGLKYSATARAGFEASGDLFVDLTVASGEAKDLGDLKVSLPKKTQE